MVAQRRKSVALLEGKLKPRRVRIGITAPKTARVKRGRFLEAQKSPRRNRVLLRAKKTDAAQRY